MAGVARGLREDVQKYPAKAESGLRFAGLVEVDASGDVVGPFTLRELGLDGFGDRRPIHELVVRGVAIVKQIT